MHFIQEWDAISQKIIGLVRAGEVYGPYYAANSATAGCEKVLSTAIVGLHEDLSRFLLSYRSMLPTSSVVCLDKYLERISANMELQPGWTGGEYLKHIIPILAALDAELSYSLSNTDEIKRRTTERAFVHLDRLIRANPSVRRDWIDAYRKGEIDAEKLGAAHLLLHGIWSFKADAKGERTDLILGEPPDSGLIASTGTTLVLTEWKKVADSSSATRKAEEGFEQAKAYAQGCLAGVELANYRYIVLVAEKDSGAKLTDRTEGGVTFRFISIAVDPDTPSQRSR